LQAEEFSKQFDTNGIDSRLGQENSDQVGKRSAWGDVMCFWLFLALWQMWGNRHPQPPASLTTVQVFILESLLGFLLAHCRARALMLMVEEN
jgi:hypothetical protein